MKDLIKETAAMIASYNPALAKAFASDPFRRVDLAHAFAAGFVRADHDDPHPAGLVAVKVAYFDRENRKLEYANAEKN